MTGLKTPGNPSTSGKNSISKCKAFITGSANIRRDLIISANLIAPCLGGHSCPGESGINKQDADCPAHCRQLQSADLHTQTPLLTRAPLCAENEPRTTQFPGFRNHLGGGQADYRMRHALLWHFAPYLAPFHTHLNALTLLPTCRGNDHIWGKGGVGALLTGRKDQWSQVPADPQGQGAAPLKHWLGELCLDSYHKVGSVRVFRNILLKESSSWRRTWQPTPVLLPGKSHGWRCLVVCSPWGHKESAMTEWLNFQSLL